MPSTRWLRSRFRSRHNSRSHSISGLIRANPSNLTPRSLEEIRQYYKDFFEGLDIPFLTVYTLHSFTIPRRISNFDFAQACSERKSILVPYFVEPPMKFQSFKVTPPILPTGDEDLEELEGDTDYRVERLPPPPCTTKMFESVKLGWGSLSSESSSEGHDDDILVLEENVPTTSIQIQKPRKTFRKRFKFNSDKNHDLSDEELSTLASTTITPVFSPDSSYCSSGGCGDSSSDKGDSGQGSSKELSPTGESCGGKDSYDCEDCTSEKCSEDHHHNDEVFRSPVASEISPGSDDGQLASSPKSEVKMESVSFSRYDNGYDSDGGNDDFLVIDLTPDELNEF